MALHNGETLLHEPEKKVPTSDFSQEELDLEMVVVCAGEFLKEVNLVITLLILDEYQNVSKQNSHVYCSTISRWSPDCLCSWSILKNEFIRSTRIRRGGSKQYSCHG